jgi:predicted transcriptional regulator of viral defense system
MSAAESLARLRALGVPVFETADAAAALEQGPQAASKTLQRLAAADLLLRVRQGVWSLDPSISPYVLAAHLTSPMPSYVSLQSALHLHGMIEQIPASTYVISLARTQRIRTARGSFSIHHVAPELFGGYASDRGFDLATPEKALFDVAYLAGTRTRLFTKLPELELPRRFRRAALTEWLDRVRAPKQRVQVERALERLLSVRR